MQRLDLMSHRLLHPGESLQHLRTEAALLASRLGAALRRHLGAGAQSLHRLHARFAQCRPDLGHPRRDTDTLAARLAVAATTALSRRRDRLAGLAVSLGHLSPQAVLERGYTLARKADGSIVRASVQVSVGEALLLTFGEGAANVQVTHKRDA
jgi:exodeoxyribonuclease VII large subunit